MDCLKQVLPPKWWKGAAYVGMLAVAFGWGYRFAVPRLEVPEGWLTAFTGFSTDGERQFHLCDVGMRSLADLSTTRVGTFGVADDVVPMRLNPMTPAELKAVEARLVRACSVVEAYQK